MKSRLLTLGDVNAFFALFVDNTVNLVILVGILSGVFGFPADFALRYMVPGTALGVLLGDLAYTWLALRLSKKLGRPDITAMPLGLDTPSTIGIATTVIGPVFLQTHDPAAAWAAGVLVMLTMGVFKTVMAFFGDAITRVLPTSALLGPLAGIGLALLALLPLMDVFSTPIAGMIGLGIVLYGLVAGHRLPYNLPAALLGVLLALTAYWITGGLGLHPVSIPHLRVSLVLPMPHLDFIKSLERLPTLIPIALPYGLLTIIGGINVTESARKAGDPYSTRDVLLIEAIATLLAGLFGGVAQSTPYIGHPAYKRMGARAGYTLYTALAIGLGAALGVLQWIIALLPKVTVAPILLFVGVEIAVQAVIASPRKEYPAVFFSMVPVFAYLVAIYGDQILGSCTHLSPSLEHSLRIAHILGGGFILTGMLWGALTAFMIQRKARALLATTLTLVLLTLFGLIHSVAPSGAAYFPWHLKDSRPYLLSIGYLMWGTINWTLLRLED